MNKEEIVCLNESCSDYLKSGGTNIVPASTIVNKRKPPTERWQCLTCGKSIPETANTPLYKSRFAQKDFLRIIRLYLQGKQIKEIAEIMQCNTKTVSGYLNKAANPDGATRTFLAQELSLSDTEIDALRSRFFSRRNAPRTKNL